MQLEARQNPLLDVVNMQASVEGFQQLFILFLLVSKSHYVIDSIVHCPMARYFKIYRQVYA